MTGWVYSVNKWSGAFRGWRCWILKPSMSKWLFFSRLQPVFNSGVACQNRFDVDTFERATMQKENLLNSFGKCHSFLSRIVAITTTFQKCPGPRLWPVKMLDVIPRSSLWTTIPQQQPATPYHHWWLAYRSTQSLPPKRPQPVWLPRRSPNSGTAEWRKVRSCFFGYGVQTKRLAEILQGR